jgi:hypothetical protein
MSTKLFDSCCADQFECSPKDSIELIKMVEEAFKTYPWKSLNRIWLTLQSVMNRIIEERGDNKFKFPHMNKERL